MKNAIEEIGKERERQRKLEGWSSAHDDQHMAGELADVAAYYANTIQPETWGGGTDIVTPSSRWPISWNKSYAKKAKKSRRRQLVVAGALIVAELERLTRAAK